MLQYFQTDSLALGFGSHTQVQQVRLACSYADNTVALDNTQTFRNPATITRMQTIIEYQACPGVWVTAALDFHNV
jgi:hypothetical protein